MGKTRIEWCDLTWSPITGCTPISEGCENCYARKMANRFRGRFGYPKDDPFRPTFHPGRLDEPDKWKKPRRVFVCSMGDLFHENITNKEIGEVWLKAFNNRKHTWIFLTKRIERLRWWSEATSKMSWWPAENLWPECMWLGITAENLWPECIWLGVTAENQVRAAERIPVLLDIPAAVRWVSLEPLLGPVNLSPWVNQLQWVVVGAETGPGKRPMDLDWARSVRGQCLDAGIPFFFKKDSNGNHELDGQIWEQYPEVKQ